MADINLNEPVDAVQAQRANNQQFLAGQNAQSNDFLNRYTGAINGQETSSALASRIGNEVGLPQLKSNALNIRNTLTNLPGTYSKATTGYDVNQNQLDRVIGTKTAALAPALDTAERSLSDAQNTVNTQMGYAQADQAKALLPYQTEQQLLTDRMARETSLYSQENQSELDALINKMNAGITLSEGEKNRAQQLAVAEMGYKQAKEAADAQAKAQASQPQTISAGQQLVDPNTGRVIYSAPYKPTTNTSVDTSTYLHPNTSTSKGAVYTPPASFQPR